MKFHTTAPNHLVPFPSDSLRPVETTRREAWEEDSLPYPLSISDQILCLINKIHLRV
jgi:hypothetical protein